MLKLEDVFKTYENGTKALKGINLTIQDGEFVFIVGPSGSGKSTIIKMMTAEVRPTSGKVSVNGYDIGSIKQREIPYLRRTVGVVFQDFRLIENKSVYENVAFVMRAVGTPQRLIKKRVTYVLDLGIAQTGGLSGISNRTVLETVQSILSAASMILLPFWEIGYLCAALQFARRQSADTTSLYHGLRHWGVVLRIMLLIMGTFLMTYTTSPISLTDGLERLLGGLKKLHVPVHELAMMMSIALRFIPTLIEETDKIMSAQKARGADFESGTLMEKAKALVPILVPLFISAFRRADELATAMECRCYQGGEGRTKMKLLRYTSWDFRAFLVAALVLAAIVTLRTFGL